MKTPSPGIYENVPFADYLSWDAFSQSGVRHILRSPKHYKYYLLTDVKTDAMRMGTLVDCLVFEPDNYQIEYVVRPATYENTKGEIKPWNMNSLVCKKRFADIEASGSEIISKENLETAEAIKESVMNHFTGAKLINAGKHQVSIVWVDEDTGVTCKARIDNYRDEGIDDLKTTVDASAGAFSRHLNQFNYHVQGAMYIDARSVHEGNVLPYHIIAAESSEPYCVMVHTIGPDSLFKGRDIYKKALRIYAECQERDKWPGYSDFAEPIDIPVWALEKDYTDDILNG